MNKYFNKIIKVEQVVRRGNLTSFFWPELYKNPQREGFILKREWYEGWFCEFKNRGLELHIQYFLTDKQNSNWPTFEINPNIKRTTLNKPGPHTIVMPPPALLFKHSAQQAEAIRKAVYLSDKFLENADAIWASQFYEEDSNASEMIYGMGFFRETSPEDIAIVNEIKRLLENLRVKFI